jgi:hypothetical protein
MSGFTFSDIASVCIFMILYGFLLPGQFCYIIINVRYLESMCTSLTEVHFFQFVYPHINPVCTSQETHYVSATNPNQLMLFGETVAVYCKNHTEHTDTLCGQNAEILCVKAGAILCSDHFKRLSTGTILFSCLIASCPSFSTSLETVIWSYTSMLSNE